MDKEAYENGLIDTEFRAACTVHGGDPEKLGARLRDELIVVEHDGQAVVGVRLKPGSDLPQLSARGRLSADKLMTVEEFVAEVKAGGHHDDAFADTSSKSGAKKESAGQDDRWHGYDFDQAMQKLSPSELLKVGRRHAPPPKAPNPRRDKAAAGLRKGHVTERDIETLKPADLLRKCRGIPERD